MRRILIVAVILSVLVPIATNASASCPNLTRTLSLGSRGQDVVQLQQFLISQNLLAAGNDTGYFGKLTQAAVQSFQRQQGIVSSGTPASTGYGLVGARTRAKIASVCGGESGTVPPTTFSASPTTGAAPLAVRFADTSITSGDVYTLDFGDGTPFVQLYGAKTSADHVYSTAGTFTARLQSSLPSQCHPDGSCNANLGFKTVGTATITVSNTSGTGANFSAYATAGRPPFNAIFTAPLALSESLDGYFVDFGDGTSGSMVRNGSSCIPEDTSCTGGPVASVYTMHTYTTSGTYIAKYMRGSQANCVQLQTYPVQLSCSGASLVATLTMTVDPSIPLQSSAVY